MQSNLRPPPETVAAAAIRLAAEYGIDTVFGIPGVHTLEYYRALSESGMNVVGARHEQGAAFMADGYARATGRPAAVSVITGPGLTNAATAIGQARSDSVPMLVLTAVNPTRERYGGRLHELPAQELVAAGLTELSFAVSSAQELADALASSFAAQRTSRPIPAIVAVPLDLLPATVDRVAARRLPPRPADPEATARAVELLSAARKPALILGGGAADAADALRELAERLRVPVLSTIAGKGIVSDASPLSLGANLPLPETREWLARRDLVLAIGTELAPTDTETEEPIYRGELIRVDLDPARFDDTHPATVGVHADAGEFAAAVLERLGGGEHGEEGPERLRPPRQGRAPWVRDSHLAALASLRAGAAEESRFYSDMTQLAYTGNLCFPVHSPRRWLHPAGFGSLGYAVPAAIGGCVGDPDTPVVALVGDSGLLYTGQEIATAVELRLPLTIVVWNNRALGQIRDDMRRSGIDTLSVHPHNGNVLALAGAYGCHGERIDDPERLGEAVARAQADRSGPTLIELEVAED